MTDLDSLDNLDELRSQGDLVEYIRARAEMLRQPAAAPPAPAPTRSARVGAWPAGCGRPETAIAISDEAVKAALAEHTAWLTAGCPAGDYVCECVGCRHLHAVREPAA